MNINCACALCGRPIIRHSTESLYALHRRLTCSQECANIHKGVTRIALRIERRYANVPLHLLPLAGGQMAIVDPEDASKVRRYLWAIRVSHGNHYAWTRIDGKNAKLHRFVIDADPGTIVDHLNGNGLDNRKGNLRIVTASQNAQNRRVYRNHFCQYKGVGLFQQTGKWRAQIKVNGISLSLGLHETPEEAARVYDQAARKHFGQFARLNFPVAGEQSAHRNEKEAA